jgi:plastocyanin
MRRLLLVGLLAGWAWLTPAVAVADTVVVTLHNNFFSPAEIVILPGDTVDWQNQQGFHDTTSDDGIWGFAPMNAPWDFQLEFDEPGDFLCHCTVHGAPGRIGMSGIVHVMELHHRPPPVGTPIDGVPVSPPVETPVHTAPLSGVVIR